MLYCHLWWSMMNVRRRATLFASIPAAAVAAADQIVFPRYNMRLPQPRQHVMYFEINACHGNKCENGCQTACQLQSVQLGPLVWHYLIFSLKENQPADVLLSCWVFFFFCYVWSLLACTRQEPKDFKGMLVVSWHEHSFFFPPRLFPDGWYRAFRHFSFWLPVISGWHFVQHGSNSSIRKTPNSFACGIRCH